MKYLTETIELLAPAKDLECGIAAIDCGADAVYIGAPRFGAREAVGNSIEDIAELVKYAHKYWARVYVTANTLLKDDEIPQAVRLISQMHDIGVDGIIIQDMGLLECELPPVPIIASTQMHNSTPEKVAFLEQIGIGRVILARELELKQIRSIRENTSVELEFFVHGALCVCYSGQCYLSYALGGRSGNRGQCAQPCRKAYTLIDSSGNVVAENKHLLSLRDLNLSGHLRELIEAGICSFKIEGRLKDKEYVTNIVSYYRMKLDRLLGDMGLSKTSSGSSFIDFTPDPGKTFNRGYSTYFLKGTGKKVGSIDTPKMKGEMVGKVVSVDKRGITLDTEMELHRGDGVCFFTRNKELRGTVVNDVSGATIVPDKREGIQKGMLIYRNHDHEFLSRLSKSRCERVISIRMTLEENNSGFTLIAADEDGVRAEASIEYEKAPAKDPEQAISNIKKQLAKCGGTGFECTGVDIEVSEPWFLPISVLNSMRREVLEAFTEARLNSHPRLAGKILKNDIPYPQDTLTFEGNVLNSKAEAFYRRHGVISIEPAAETGLDLTNRKVMTTRYCVRHQLDICPKTQRSVSTPNPFYLLDNEGNRLQLRFDCAKCQMEVYLRESK